MQSDQIRPAAARLRIAVVRFASAGGRRGAFRIVRSLRERPWLSTIVVTAVVSIGAVFAGFPRPSTTERVGVEQTAPVLDSVENHSAGPESDEANAGRRASFIPAGSEASDRTARSSGTGQGDAMRHGGPDAGPSRNAASLPQPPSAGPARAAWLTGSIESVETHGRGGSIGPDEAVLLPPFPAKHY